MLDHIEKSKKWTIYAIFLFFLTILITQISSDCFISEFNDDESSHYLSGLMIHDYLISGFHISPINYLKWYYSHYPIIGIGHWGPMFYGIEAAWMLLFSPSRISVLLLSTAMTTAAATSMYYYGYNSLKLKKISAFFASIAFIICPITQSGSNSVMLDIPITLFGILSTLSYVKYIETESIYYSILFGIISTISILTKGNGAAMAIIPILLVFFNQKWYLLGKFSFWAPAILVVVIAGPWYAMTYNHVAAGFRYTWGFTYTKAAITQNAVFLWAALGPVILALAAIGAASGIRRDPAFSSPGFKGAVALLAAVWIFQSTAPADLQDRYLAPLLPALFLLAAMGAQVVATTIQQRTASRAMASLAFVIPLLSMVPAALHPDIKKPLGIIELAKVVWANRTPTNPVVLIAAKESSEVAAVAELAMADPARPSIFAVRGSRLLGGGGYNRSEYLPKFANAKQAEREINAFHIPLVLYQADPGGWAHVAQVDAIQSNAKPAWQILGQTGSKQAPVTLYKLPQSEGMSADAGQLLQLSSPNGL